MRKRLVFMGLSLDDLRDFPAATRRAVGFDLGAVQAELMPSDFKPMSTVGPSPGGVRSGYHGPGAQPCLLPRPVSPIHVTPVAEAQDAHDDAFVLNVANDAPVAHLILPVAGQAGAGQGLADAARVVDPRDSRAQEPEQAGLDRAVGLLRVIDRTGIEFNPQGLSW